MALNKAVDFVKKVGYDKALRAQCISYSSKKELLSVLGFDEIEFEDAVNMQLVKCQTYDEAEVFQQLKMWFSIL